MQEGQLLLASPSDGSFRHMFGGGRVEQRVEVDRPAHADVKEQAIYSG
jgi:hypothetical protein